MLSGLLEHAASTSSPDAGASSGNVSLPADAECQHACLALAVVQSVLRGCAATENQEPSQPVHTILPGAAGTVAATAQTVLKEQACEQVVAACVPWARTPVHTEGAQQADEGQLGLDEIEQLEDLEPASFDMWSTNQLQYTPAHGIHARLSVLTSLVNLHPQHAPLSSQLLTRISDAAAASLSQYGQRAHAKAIVELLVRTALQGGSEVAARVLAELHMQAFQVSRDATFSGGTECVAEAALA